MKTVTLAAAYIPLVDAAPLIVAQEMGFAEAEGLSLELIRAPSWSSVRDMLAFGRVDAAHLLSPVPVAMALGLGGVTTRLAAVSVLSVNGISMPAIYGEGEAPVFPETCTVEPDWRAAGEALCPERYPVEKLRKYERRLGSYFWEALFQQSPKPRSGAMFQREWFPIVEAAV